MILTAQKLKDILTTAPKNTPIFVEWDNANEYIGRIRIEWTKDENDNDT